MQLTPIHPHPPNKPTMSPSQILLSLAFTLLFHTTLAVDPLAQICSTSSVDDNSPSILFNAKLNVLLKHLAIDTTLAHTGFSTATIPPLQGLALCRGDVSSHDCDTCVHNATRDILALCPDSKSAIVWYDNCLLKYSDTTFLGQIDEKNKIYLTNTQNTTDPVKSNEETQTLLSQLSEEAVASSTLFATGYRELDESTTLYGLVQCTRDLSSYDCKRCLDEAVGELLSCCDGKRGGRVLGGSCNFRYEMYPFFNS